MKKAISLLLALVMCLSLVACGGGNETPETTEAPITTTPTTIKSEISEPETTAPIETEPQYETVEISLENWHEYFEIRIVAFELFNAFNECTDINADIRLCLKEEYKTSVVDMDVAVEASCTDGYKCWFTYNKQTAEIIEGEKVDYSGAFAKPVVVDNTNTFALKKANIEQGASLFPWQIFSKVEWEGDIATFEGEMYSNIEIVRIQGTITIAE